MGWVAAYLRRRRGKPWVRPYALVTPIAILVFCLPLLRPLRHPGRPSQDEQLRLATIAAFVEHPTDTVSPLADRLDIDPAGFTDHSHIIQRDPNSYFSDQSPVMAILLSGPYWILHRLGHSMTADSVLVPYLLTLLGVTLPAAMSAGLIYRMARLFELSRRWRSLLSASVVFATGLVSYATVLNPHVPAATLILAATACLIHVYTSPQPYHGGGFLILAGFCAALAGVIDLSALIFLPLLPISITALRMRIPLRIGGVILYLFGATPPILLYAVLTIPITGNLLPGSYHHELALPASVSSISSDDDAIDANSTAVTDSTNEFDSNPSVLWTQTTKAVSRFLWSLFGAHGLLVHFPVVILGFAGMLAVMHRNWPTVVKILAASSCVSILIALVVFATRFGSPSESSQSQFANRWLILFLPILLFWVGGWLRQPHHRLTWLIAAILLIFSVIVTLLGATDPMPRTGYHNYTATAALRHLY